MPPQGWTLPAGQMHSGHCISGHVGSSTSNFQSMLPYDCATVLRLHVGPEESDAPPQPLSSLLHSGADLHVE